MGLKAAFKSLDVVERADLGLPPPEQLSLLGADAGAITVGGAPEPERKDGPGRPPGAGNKADGELARYLLACGYRDPAIALAELGGGASLEELVVKARFVASGLGAKPIDVFKLLLDAVKENMRYWHAARTPEKGANDGPGVVIVYAAGDVQVGDNIQQNQVVIAGSLEELNGR